MHSTITLRKRPNCILPPCFRWWFSLNCKINENSGITGARYLHEHLRCLTLSSICRMQRGKELLASWSISFRDMSTASFGCVKTSQAIKPATALEKNIVKSQERRAQLHRWESIPESNQVQNTHCLMLRQSVIIKLGITEYIKKGLWKKGLWKKGMEVVLWYSQESTCPFLVL